MVITSQSSQFKLDPEDHLLIDPVYVAYHNYGAGHYDATSTTTIGKMVYYHSSSNWLWFAVSDWVKRPASIISKWILNVLHRQTIFNPFVF